MEKLKENLVKTNVIKETGSITLFILISIIFFLIIAISIYVNVSNKTVAQETEISKIKSEYEISKEQMNEKYEEAIKNNAEKVIITGKKEVDNSEYISGTLTNSSVKVTIEFPETAEESEKIVYINGNKTQYTGEFIIEETTTIKVIYKGKEQIFQINIDKISPTVKIAANKTSPTNASSIIYTFTFSEEVKEFTAEDIQVTNGTKGNFSGSGKIYTLTVANSGSTTQTVQVPSNKCTDLVGNGNIESEKYSILIDRTPPTVTITADQTSPTNASSITYTFTFSEDVTGFTAEDIQVTNGTKGTFSGSGKTYTLVVTQSSSTTQTVKVDANKCIDVAGNGNSVSNTLTIEINRKQTLTINPNGGTYAGTSSTTSIKQDPGTKYTLSSPTPPTGYKVTFSGNGGTAKTGSITSKKIFSSWSKTSGAGSLSGSTYTFGEGTGEVKANYSNGSITLTSASRSGYIFQGWYDASGKYIGTAGTTYTPAANITLTAHWQLAVAQIGSTLYPSLASAIDAVPANNVNTTITMLQNTSENVTVPANKNINLNLNNKTVSGKNNTLSTITNKGTLKTYGGTIRYGQEVIANYNKLTISSGTYIAATSAVIEQNQGLFTFTGGTLSGNQGHTVVMYDGNMNMTGGNIIYNKTNSGATALMNSGGILSVTGGTVTSTGYCITTRSQYATAKSTVKNITINKVEATGAAVQSDLNGDMILHNCTINANTYLAAYTDIDAKNNMLVLINCKWGSAQIGGNKVVAVNTDQNGYDVYFYGFEGESSMSFATWTEANGQDDIIWESGTKVTNSSRVAWYYRVNKSAHKNENGVYSTHIYKSDNTTFILGFTITI